MNPLLMLIVVAAGLVLGVFPLAAWKACDKTQPCGRVRENPFRRSGEDQMSSAGGTRGSALRAGGGEITPA